MWVIPRLTQARSQQGINFDEWRLHKQRSSSLFLTFFFKEWKSTFAVRGRGFTHVSWFSACFQYTCVSACSIRIITHILCICAACMRWRRWWSSSKPFKCTFEVYSIPRYTFIYTEWEQPKFIEFNVRCSLVCERAFRTIVEFQCLLCARFSLCVNCFYDYLFVRSFVWRSLPPPLLIEYTHKT